MRRYLTVLLLLIVASPLFADSSSILVTGASATNLRLPNGQILTGANVEIGQVEPGRPAKMPPDSAINVNPSVLPFQVSEKAGGAAQQDANIDLGSPGDFEGHATGVASVMISTDSADSNGNGRALSA